MEDLHYENPNGYDVIIDSPDTELVYHLSFLPCYEKRVEALRITVTIKVDDYPKFYKDHYQTELVDPKETKPLKHGDTNDVAISKIVRAHYGVSEIIDGEEGRITMIYVLPIDMYEIRPVPVDKNAPRIIVLWPKAHEIEEDFVNTVKSRCPDVSIPLVREAIDIIKKYHSEDKRKSGEPFYLHPIAVAKIVTEYSTKQEVVIAALLHDTLEDTSLHPTEIKTIFGLRVTELVLGVIKIDYDGVPRFMNDAESLKYLQQQDEDTLTVKLADRMHNMRTINGHSSEDKRRKIAQETLDFFVPLAKKLCHASAHDELKRMAEKVLQDGRL